MTGSSIADPLLLNQPFSVYADHDQRFAAVGLEGIGAVVLAEADLGAVGVDRAHLEHIDAHLDVLGRGYALPACLLPFAARLAVGRLEIARVIRQVGIDVLFRPRLCPAEHGLAEVFGTRRSTLVGLLL